MTIKVVQALLKNNVDSASGKYPQISNLAIPVGSKVRVVVPVKILALPAKRAAATWFVTQGANQAANVHTGIFQTVKKIDGNDTQFNFVQTSTLKVNGNSVSATESYNYNQWYIMDISGTTNNAETNLINLGSPAGNNGMVSSLWAYEDLTVFVDDVQAEAKVAAEVERLKVKFNIG